MRQAQIFAGSSHPTLVNSICDRLGLKAGGAELRKFSNGETSVQITTSIRNQDVFIVQSGSSQMNDNVMELLIMISACKGGSAKSITAVMPYFPYSRQSKRKHQRGAITARMIANLLKVAGVNHVITIDLHANQMQGFFSCPVDNLVAEPLIAKWIKYNVPDWKRGVAVSKNPGGTKRVTSLADALKLDFGIVTTDRRRFNTTDQSMSGSLMFDKLANSNRSGDRTDPSEEASTFRPNGASSNQTEGPSLGQERSRQRKRTISNARTRGQDQQQYLNSPLAKSTLVDKSPSPSPSRLTRVNTAPAAPLHHLDDAGEEFIDERAKDVIHGRFVHGHIVDEDYPSPSFSARSTTHPHSSNSSDGEPSEHMMASFMSTASSYRREGRDNTLDNDALGGSADAAASSDEEEAQFKDPELQTDLTLVGNVRGRVVFIVDDMIDKPKSWIAAAELCVKRGGATKVYIIATHGLFGGDCLDELNACQSIDGIVVTNSFPISEEKQARCSKLQLLDVSMLLGEAIRRNHNGESISNLYMHSYYD